MNIFTKLQFWLLSALVCADSLFFSLFNPSSVASSGLIIAFVLFVTTLYVLAHGLLRVGRWYGLPTAKRQKRLASIAVAVVGGMVALQSMGQLSGRDLLVLLPLVLIGYFYTLYAPAPKED